jgi:hypothetical protein
MSKSRIDFVTPIPLIICLARLPKAYIHPTGNGDYNFETPLEPRKGQFSILQARLNLSSQGTETHITGGMYIAQETYLLPIFWILLAFIAIQIVGIPSVCFPIALGMMIVLLLVLRYYRYLTEKRLLDAFRHFKYKKQTFAWWQRLVFPAIKLQREVPVSLYDLTNKLYRLNYETDYVQMRERKERYFVINQSGARIFGWMRVIDNEQTAIQYWIGFDPIWLGATVLIGSLWLTLIPILFELPLAQKLTQDYFMQNFAFAGIFFVLTTPFQCISLWRKFRTTLNSVEMQDLSMLQSLNQD